VRAEPNTETAGPTPRHHLESFNKFRHDAEDSPGVLAINIDRHFLGLQLPEQLIRHSRSGSRERQIVTDRSRPHNTKPNSGGVTVKLMILTTILWAACCSFAQPAAKPTTQELPLPDVMVMSDGSRVTSPDQWPKRRAEMLELVQSNVYGHLPPTGGETSFVEIIEHKAPTGMHRQYKVHLRPLGQSQLCVGRDDPAGRRQVSGHPSRRLVLGEDAHHHERQDPVARICAGGVQPL
jgi:hypothetical protein